MSLDPSAFKGIKDIPRFRTVSKALTNLGAEFWLDHRQAATVPGVNDLAGTIVFRSRGAVCGERT